METIRLIEAFRNLFYSPLYVTMALGLFESEGLAVSARPRGPGEQIIPLLRQEAADIALTGIMRSLVAADAGDSDYPVAFIEVNSRDGFMLLSRERWESFQWNVLEGRTVITYREPPTPWMCLLRVLREQNVDEAKVLLSNERQIPEAIDAFKEGFADFIQLPEPMAEQLIADGLADLAAPMGRFVGDVPYSSFAVLPSFLADRGDTLLRFTRAIYSGQQWIAQHDSNDIARLASEHLPGIPVEVLAAGVERYTAQDTWAKDPLLRPEGFYRLQDILREGGLIQGRHRYEDQVTTTFADAAMSGG